MSKKAEEDAQPEALATFAAAARNNGVKPAGQGSPPQPRPQASRVTWKPTKRTRPTLSEATRLATKSA
jgi:hypothetical protein